MRLFFLPLSSKQAFTYCQRTAASPSPEAGLVTSLVDKVTGKATKTWARWEKAEKGWQNVVVGWGDRLLAKIPYQEWGFKSIPAPPEAGYDYTKGPRITLSYPSSIISESSLLSRLRTEATERQAFHRQKLWISCVGMPFTLPIGLIPIVPNLPFFYLCYRAYSHWRAVGGSRHLMQLLERDLISLQPAPILDVIYHAGLLDIVKGRDSEGKHQVLQNTEASGEMAMIRPWNAKLIAPAVECDELEGEVNRALEQVYKSIEQQQQQPQTNGQSKATS